MSILIIADPWDSHAHPVIWALNQRGIEANLWYSHNFPQKRGLSLLIEDHSRHANFAPQDFEISLHDEILGGEKAYSDVHTVWLRRWYKPAPSNELHPADQQFSLHESTECLQTLLYALDEQPRFWVNPLRAKLRADRKGVQLIAAKRCGLTIPDTLISNDPAKIRKFFADRNGQVIYKSLTPVSWVPSGEGNGAATYTSALNEQLLADDGALSGAPGIFQTHYLKAFELRVTVIGQNIFATKILSQQEGFYPTDWRANQLSAEMKVEPYELPESIRVKILSLMKAMGLLYGAMDFMVTPQGEFVFLEVNEMGQFLWVESLLPDVPLLDCFCKFLVSRDPNFVYRPEADCVRLEDHTATLPSGDVRPVIGENHVPLPIWYALRE